MSAELREAMRGLEIPDGMGANIRTAVLDVPQKNCSGI